MIMGLEMLSFSNLRHLICVTTLERYGKISSYLNALNITIIDNIIVIFTFGEQNLNKK